MPIIDSKYIEYEDEKISNNSVVILQILNKYDRVFTKEGYDLHAMDVMRLRVLDLFVTFVQHPKVGQYYERPVYFYVLYEVLVVRYQLA